MNPCAHCGSRLYAGSADGLCPACLIQLAQQESRPHFNTPPAPAHSLNGQMPGLEFLSLIGNGGMGAVYLARQTELDRPVAVKILPQTLAADPTFVERFRREAKALARLDHPNIVRVFGSGVSNGYCYIVMEYVEGVTLREAIREKAVDPKAALRIVPQIVAALEYAHSAGVVHRDIKPENILLGVGGVVKVTDFGLAKLNDNNGEPSQLTLTGTTMGTLRYMAPEQFDGTATDHRTDIYALGVVFYELLTGRVPMGHFPLPSDTPGVDPRIDAVVMRTLQREPNERYQQFSELRTDLHRIDRGEQALLAGGQPGIPPTKEMLARVAAFSGKEWKSRTTLWGIPLLHIAYGFDPKTGKKRVAKGIIAIGDVAFGGIAVGGVACGLISWGGVACGLTAIGCTAIGLQLALGGAAMGGMAIGGAAIGGLAFGGAAVGGVALGGSALGYLAIGGGSAGKYTFSGGRFAPEEFANSRITEVVADPMMPWWIVLAVAAAVIGPTLLVMVVAAITWMVRRDPLAPPNPIPSDLKPKMLSSSLLILGLTFAFIFVLRMPFQYSAALRAAVKMQQAIEMQQRLDAERTKQQLPLTPPAE